MKLYEYDFLLIVLANRFTENTLWLVKVLTEQHKPFFIIRSKLDIEITMKKKWNPELRDDNFKRIKR